MGNVKYYKLYVALTILLFFALPRSAMAATLSVGQAQGAPGAQDVVIPITLISAAGEGVASFNADINFDSQKLSLKQITAGSAAAAAGKELQFSTPASGRAKIIIAGLNKTTMANGVVANISFSISQDAGLGNVPVTISNVVASGSEAQRVSLNVTNGNVVVAQTSGTPAASAESGDAAAVSAQTSSGTAVTTTSSGISATPVVNTVYLNQAPLPVQESETSLNPTSAENAGAGEEIVEAYKEEPAYESEKISSAPLETKKEPVAPPKPKAADIQKEKPAIAVERKSAPEINIKEMTSFWIWRQYVLDIKTSYPPCSWTLSNGSKLPYFLKLDWNKGVISGIVWGRGSYDLMLEITTLDKEKVKAPLKLIIE